MWKRIKFLLDPFHREIRRRISVFAKTVPDGALLLDAGAGEGQYHELFSHCRLIGLDAAIGDESWDYSALDIVGDLHRIPLKSASVDGVLSVVTMEHLHSPWLAMAEMARVTRVEGRSFFVVPFLWEMHQEPNDFFRFTVHGFTRLAKDAGFRVESIVPMGGLFRVFHYRTASLLKSAVHYPLLLVFLVPFLPFLLGFLFLSGLVDRIWKLCDHTLGYTAILIRER
ncbi:MAG: class I SAM-dependent methyltransferase [Acidobacteria bacterium]|nr:class I SAM-dependent methyltransferase [Acidobacteriota bacterium]